VEGKEDGGLLRGSLDLYVLFLLLNCFPSVQPWGFSARFSRMKDSSIMTSDVSGLSQWNVNALTILRMVFNV
jgi:hypothetical protein